MSLTAAAHTARAEAAVASKASAAVAPAPAPPRPPQVLDPTAELRFPEKVHIRLETKGRAGKTVTRLSGIQVAVVLKPDQETGKLTVGVCSDVLTSSPQHPRGIKVRLESGEVGRVQGILLGPLQNSSSP